MIATKRTLAAVVILVLASGGHAAAQNRAWLGVALSCSYCEWQTTSGRDVWRFSEAPVIASVDPSGPAARLGIRAGDVLTALDGHPMTTEAGANRLAEAKPNDTLRVTYRRGDETRTLTMVAAVRPVSDPAGALGAGGRDLTQALSRAGRGPGPDSPVRFSGGLSGLSVEIRGSPDVTVLLDDGECGMVILTPTARVTLTAPKGCASRSPNK